MNTYKLKTVFLSITIFTILFFNSCSKDEVIPHFVETGMIVNAEDIPEVTSALLNRMGLDKGNGRFSVNNGVSDDIFSIDWDKILQLVDSTGKETYTFSIQDDDDNPFIFYNLVIRFNEYGNAFFPFIMKYEMSEEFIPVYLQTNSMKNFSGKISKIIISQPSSSNLENSANHGPDYVRSITGNPDCPQEEIDMSEGESTSGGGYLPPSGGGGGFTSYTVYEVCEYYIQDFYFITVTAAGVNSVVYDYSIIREECHTEIVYHNTTPDGNPECEIGDGNLPIVSPSPIRDKIDDTQLSDCHKQVLNSLIGKSDWISYTVFKLFGSSIKFDINFVTTNANDRDEAGWTDYPFNYNASTGRYKTNIYINNRYESTNLSVAKTILHEIMHAYLMFEHKNNPNFSEVYEDLVNSWAATRDLGYSQHEEIGNYIDEIAKALQNYDSNSQSGIDYYYGLSWGGLAQTSAFSALSNDVQADYLKIINDELNNTSSAKGTLCK